MHKEESQAVKQEARLTFRDTRTRQGHREGQREGREVGLAKGFELGEEVGFYSGVVQALQANDLNLNLSERLVSDTTTKARLKVFPNGKGLRAAERRAT